MPNRRPPSLWTVFLVTAPAIALAVLLSSVVMLSNSLHSEDSEYLTATTDLVAESIEKYLDREVTSTFSLARIPRVISEVDRLGSADYFKAEVEQRDAAWQAADRADDDISLLSRELSQFLRSFVDSPNSPYRELLIADAHGRLVAASNRTEDYDQADDDWWPLKGEKSALNERCSRSPEDCASIADVSFDRSAGVTAFAAVVPIVDQGRVTGVIKAVIDTGVLDTLLKLAYHGASVEGRILGASGRDILNPEFATPEVVQNALMTLAVEQEWGSGNHHLRITNSRYQQRHWAIYSEQHSHGGGQTNWSTGLLLAFTALMVAVSGLAAALGFTGRSTSGVVEGAS